MQNRLLDSKKPLIFLITMYFLSGITAFIISILLYRTVVFPVPFIAVIPLLYILVLDLRNKQYQKYNLRVIIIHTSILLSVMLVFRLAIVPKYNYFQAKQLVINNLNERSTDYVVMPLEFVAQSIPVQKRQSFFVMKYYVIRISVENKTNDYIISPFDGEYVIRYIMEGPTVQ